MNDGNLRTPRALAVGVCQRSAYCFKDRALLLPEPGHGNRLPFRRPFRVHLRSQHRSVCIFQGKQHSGRLPDRRIFTYSTLCTIYPGRNRHSIAVKQYKSTHNFGGFARGSYPDVHAQQGHIQQGKYPDKVEMIGVV